MLSSLPSRYFEKFQLSLKEFWDTSHMTDVKLVVEGQSLQAHKLVLAAGSAYFKAMFSGAFRESKQEEVNIGGVTKTGLMSIVGFLYSGEVKLTQENVEDILKTAHILEVPLVVEYCVEFILSNVSIDDCLRFLEIGREFQTEELISKCQAWLISNFTVASKAKTFMDVPKDTLIYALSNDETKGTELDFFKAAEKWLLNDPDRMQHTVDVMRHIRFGLISIEDTRKYVLQSELLTCDQFHSIIQETYSVLSTKSQYPFVNRNMGRPRVTEKCVISIKSPDPPKSNVYAFNIEGKNALLQGMPYSTLISTPPVVIGVDSGRFVYIFGCTNYNQRGPKFREVVRYSVPAEQWETMTPMSEGRFSHSGCQVGDDIIIAGGYTVDDNNVTQSVERYSIKDDLWDKIANLPEKISDGGICGYDADVFLCGGIVRRRQYRKETYKYCYLSNKWERKSDLNHGRAYHDIIQLLDVLIAAGGCGNKEQGCPPVEAYNVTADQWTIIDNSFSDLKVPRLVTTCMTCIEEAEALLVGYDADDDTYLDRNNRKMIMMKLNLNGLSDMRELIGPCDIAGWTSLPKHLLM